MVNIIYVALFCVCFGWVGLVCLNYKLNRRMDCVVDLVNLISKNMVLKGEIAQRLNLTIKGIQWILLDVRTHFLNEMEKAIASERFEDAERYKQSVIELDKIINIRVD